jgi:hypothetical protein
LRVRTKPEAVVASSKSPAVMDLKRTSTFLGLISLYLPF